MAEEYAILAWIMQISGVLQINTSIVLQPAIELCDSMLQSTVSCTSQLLPVDMRLLKMSI